MTFAENERPLRIAIVEDDTEIRTSLVSIINGSNGFTCVQSCATAEDALSLLPALHPDVVLMDIRLPGMSGIAATQSLKEQLADTDIVMLTVQDDDESIFASLCAGATGYLIKNTAPAKLLQSIEEVRSGGSPMSASIARRVATSFKLAHSEASPLSGRETEILSHLCDGESYRVIAERLYVSGHTVRAHIKNIYKKLHVSSRAEAVRTAMARRLI